MSGWLPGFLLALAPLLLFVGLLILGRYPGERTIQRCRRAITLLLEPDQPSATGRRRRLIPVATFRGGRLIASSLAGRGPPFTA